MSVKTPFQRHAFLAGGSEMGTLTRNKDWSLTSAGPVENWPQSLRTTLGILLNSKFPMFLFWGPELICFYNDAYRPSLGENGKHPEILGMPAKDGWPEIWHIIKPLIDQVLAGGEATWSEDQLIPIFRNGKIEDVYWTFSYSPVNDESGDVAGVLVTCSETTDKINILTRLAESKDQLEFAIEATELATWDFNPATNKFISNDRLKTWFGLMPEEEIDLQIAIDSISEIDRERVIRAIEEALQYSSGGGYDIEYTIVHPQTKQQKVVQAKGRSWFNEEKIAYRFNGTLEDVTEKVMARKKLEESEKEFRQLADTLPVLVWTTDAAGVQAFASKKWKEFSGLDPDPENFQKIVHPADLEKVNEIWAACLKSGESYKTEIRLKDKKGEYYWFYVNGDPVKNSSGLIEKWIGTFVNINEQKNAEEFLTAALHKVEESEKRFRNVADSAPVLIWMAGTDRGCYYVNKAWLNFSGRKMKQETGDGWQEGIHPDDLERCINTYTKAFDRKEEFYLEYRLRRHDGEYRWIADNCVPRFTADGIFEGYIAACMDIHVQTMYQKQTEEAEERLRLAAEAAELATWDLDLQTREIIYSSRLSEIFGLDPSKKITHPQIRSQIHPDDIHAIVEKAFEIAMQTGVYRYEARILMPDNTIRWIRTQGKIFYDQQKKPVKLIGTLRDITEEKSRQQELIEREQKFRVLANFMPQFVWTGDADGHLNYFNNAVFDYSGLNAEEIEKDGWLQIVHPDDREENIAKWMHSIQTGEDFLLEHRFRRQDGAYRWQLSRAVPHKDANGKIQMWIGTSTDIEEQKNFAAHLEKQVNERTAQLKELNEALIKSEERYHLMVEEVEDYSILYLSREGVIENWNKGAEKIKGYHAEEIIGKNFSVFYTDEDQHRQLPATLLKLARDEGKAVQEGWRVRKDGSFFWANVVITTIHDENKNIIGYSKVTHDLTAKKDADDKIKMNAAKLEEKNTELEKMNKELQSFSYVASHDLQEPLRKIQVFAALILENEKSTLSENGSDYFRRMQAAAQRMQILIDDLLAYSRTNITERNFEKIHLTDILEQVKKDLKEDIQQKHAVIETTELCEVNIIPFQFRQLLNNLISNALKFSKPDMPPHICVESKIEEGNKTALTQLLPDQTYCHVIVSDDGIGFDPQYSDRIFEVFQRLHGKAEYKGTGIGLAIVKKIVENHNGIITATGQPGKGARFDIYFPVETSPA